MAWTHAYVGSFQLGISRVRGRGRVSVLALPLVVWLRGNALVSKNVVTLCRARLVPGWVTTFGQVDYHGM